MHVSTNLDVDLVAVETADQVNLLLELQAPQLPDLATAPSSCSAEPRGGASRNALNGPSSAPSSRVRSKCFGPFARGPSVMSA